MRRFFVEEIKAEDGSLRIGGPEAKHITRVLRMGRGERLIIMDGRGDRFEAVIESAGPREVLLTLQRPLPKPPRSPVEITICQGLLKSRAMDYMVRNTSELGINRIFPFQSERTVIKLDGNRFLHKRRHWAEVARSAAKQSDRGTPAEIGPLCLFEDLVEKFGPEDALKVILWKQEGALDLKGILRSSSAGLTPTLPSSPKGKATEGVKKFVGIVGPEGGFTQKEIQLAGEAGFRSASLGYRVLRAETAAIALVTLVQYEWGDLGLNWPETPDTRYGMPVE